MLVLLRLVLAEKLVQLFCVGVLVKDQVVLELREEFKLAAILVVLPGVGLHEILLFWLALSVISCGLFGLVLVLGAILVQNGWRLIQWIQPQSERVVQQLRNDPRQQWTTNLQARIRIGFDQVDLEIFINHEVVTENLK